MAANRLTASSYISLFLLLLSSPLPSTSQNSDLETLLQIKQQWLDSPALTSWTRSTPHCTWPGISCSNSSSVTALLLPNLNLPGPIPNAISTLRSLSILNLSNNSISGPFPTFLYNCSSLRLLDLSQNFLTGPLPRDINRLPASLTTLILSDNNFTGSIPPSLTLLAALRELHLDNNFFNGSIPSELSNLSNLDTLYLAYNLFLPTRIPPSFSNLTKLTYFWMTSTNLIGQIPDSFSNLTELVHLDLAQNSLTGSIPAWIWNLSNLQSLYLSDNSFSGDIEATNMNALQLVGIDVSSNQLTGSIPETFGKMPNLSLLFMYYNQLSGEIPLSIAELPSLSDLRLFNNKLSGPLPPELGKHSPLSNIEVDDNWISGELPGDLCARGAFTSLVVFDNNLTGSLPASLGRCATLNNIMIQRNGFTGEVPAGIWSAVNLTTAIMSDNALSGTLPDVLPWNLMRLDIQNNRFSGRIPSSAGKLLLLAASRNQFSGPIRTSGMPLLLTLSLGANLLSGEIPTDISLLRFLTDLNLSSNQLVGPIPAGIGSIPVLTSLDLSVNQLSGSIPAVLGNLKLNFLNLSNNHLSGKIPAPLENRAYDRSFLSNPQLCGLNSFESQPCNYRSGKSSGLSPTLWIVLMLAAALLILITGGLSFIAFRKKWGLSDNTDWKLTSFQSREFSETKIRQGLIDDNLIGSGGDGKVYRIAGCSRAGGTVAVKKIWNRSKLDSKLEQQFNSEVKILGSLRHLNIVKLLCCISSANTKLLVYEYMENGSLDRWLHAPTPSPLDWPTRLHIAIGAAQGLCYMHHSCSPAIIHRDVKSSNILLDSAFRAQIADFGLARMLGLAGEQDTVSAVAGSIGYMAPECAYTLKLGQKVDVYSFGVVLLELTTGRPASGGVATTSLAEWAWQHVQEGNKMIDAIDERIPDRHVHLTEIAVVMKLGLVCTGSLPSTRPTMKDVVQILLRCDRTASLAGDKVVAETESMRLWPAMWEVEYKAISLGDLQGKEHNCRQNKPSMSIRTDRSLQLSPFFIVHSSTNTKTYRIQVKNANS